MADNDPCFEMLKSLGTVSEAEAKDILDYVDALKNDPNRAAQLKLKIQQHTEAAKIRKYQAQASAQAFHNFEQTVLGPGKSAVESKKIPSIYHAMSGWLVGQNKDFKGNQGGIDAEMRGASGYVQQYLFSRFVKTFNTTRWMHLSRDKHFVHDLVHELAGETDTGNPLAKQMAGYFSRVFSAGVKRLNAAGAHIQEMEKYMFTQSHSPLKLAKMGETNWANFVRPLLNSSKTFGADDPDKVLHNIYLDIMNGEYLDPYTTATGRNIANSLSAHRALIFKNADAALAYHERAGQGNILSSLFSHAGKQASQAVLMERLGPNPGAMFERILQATKNTMRETATPLTKLQEEHLTSQFKAVSGEYSQVASYKIAAFADAIRAGFGTLPRLGMSAISSFSDANNMRVNLMLQGYPAWEAAATSASRMFKWMTFQKPLSRDQIENLWGAAAGMHAMSHRIASRWTAEEPISDTVRRAQSILFMLSRQASWDDHFEFGTSAAWMHLLARNASKSWDNLSAATQDMLHRTGFEEKEWNIIRAVPQVKSGLFNYLTPDKIANRELRTKYIGALYDMSTRTVPRPGARQIATFPQVGKRGTPAEEVLKTMAMFKTFPLGVMQKMWASSTRLHGNPVLGVADFAIGATVMGYVSLAVKNLLTGKEPPDPRDFETWLESAGQGGAGSLFGDIIAPGQKPGAELGNLVTGPVWEDAEDWLKGAKAYGAQGKAPLSKKYEAAAIPILRSDIPYVNLWFSKLAWQYGMVYPTMESVHPGSVDKMIQTAQQQYNEKYWLKPAPK